MFRGFRLGCAFIYENLENWTEKTTDSSANSLAAEFHVCRVVSIRNEKFCAIPWAKQAFLYMSPLLGGVVRGASLDIGKVVLQAS